MSNRKSFSLFFILTLMAAGAYPAASGKRSGSLWQRWEVYTTAQTMEVPSWNNPPLDIINQTPSDFFEQQKQVNPHRKFDCLICHKDKPDLEKDSNADITLNAPNNEILLLCAKCHQKEGFHTLHSEPKRIKVPPDGNLPLPRVGYSKGMVVCTTCHDVHAPSSDSYLLRDYGPQTNNPDRDQFCNTCHQKWRDQKFHKLTASSDIKLCLMCHDNNPYVNTGNSRAFSFDMARNCNFCHDSLSDKHYLSQLTVPYETLKKNPGAVGMTRFKRVFTCVSCHLPHTGKDELPGLLREGYYQRLIRSKDINPHGSTIYCSVCHQDDPKEALAEKSVDELNALCLECHQASDQATGHHPVGMRPRVKRFIKYDRQFQLKRKRMTCLSCHDLFGHEDGKQPRKRYFLRGEQYDNLREFCDKCHVRSIYSKLDAHRQLGRKGELVGSICGLCHVAYDRNNEKLDKDCSECHFKKLGMSRLSASHLKLKASPNFLCYLCHDKKTRIGRAEHLGKVMDKGKLEHLGKVMLRDQVSLPLNKKSEVLCVTCHYQHQVGALSGGHEPVYRYFYRLRNKPDKLCKTCHE